MSERSIGEITRARLAAYGLFDERVILSVAKLAQTQEKFSTYQSLFKKVGVPLKPTLFVSHVGRGVALVDIDSREEKELGVIVLHLPMGNSLDPNQLYIVATIALACPSYRIIAFGNPSGPPLSYKEEGLSLLDWIKVAFTKHLRAIISPELEYLSSQDIKGAVHIGYSLGASKAILAAHYSDPARVAKLILLDPVAHPRYPQQLLKDFQSSFSPMGEYVNRTRMQTYFDARKDAANTVRHNRGLLRPVNGAIGAMLTRVDFLAWLGETLQKQPALTAFVSWAEKSEVGNDAHMAATLHNYAFKTAPGRVARLRLKNDTHAYGNDIFLTVAIVKQALLS